VIFLLAVNSQRSVADRPIVLSDENLTRLRNGLLARGIQDGFCSFLKTPQSSYRRFKEGFEATVQKPFMVVDAERNEFGGYFLLVVFQKHSKLYRLWLYETDKNKFEIREISPLKTTLNSELMTELGKKDYFPYWLRACSS
jgi:hypothetical protein